MNRHPHWNEAVEVETWPARFERFYATREFRITGDKGAQLGAATTLWVFFDLNRKRPVRVPPEIVQAYGVNPVRLIEHDFPSIPGASNPENEMPFRVRLSDIDTNEHVNNTRYVEWMLEAVPRHIHMDIYPAFIEVAYRRETGYGSTVISQAEQVQSSNEQVVFIHSIVDSKNGDEVATARTGWLKREI